MDDNCKMRFLIRFISLFFVALAAFAQGKPSRPIVGAIRWDAWTGGGVTRQVEATLGPEKYHHRLPWFAEVIGPNRVRIDGSPQSVMDGEIAYAADAGLDYWAFLLYPADSTMSTALRQYLQSPQRHRLNFCVILHNAFSVSDAQWPSERDRAVALLREPGYQTVLNGRPLVFAFQVQVRGEFPSGRMADFRRAAQKAGLNPYCVFMGWNPANDFREQSRNGFEAVSAYAFGSSQATFAELAQSVERNYWQNAAAAHVPYIPLVTTGWDKQPRKDNPVSWEKDHAYHQQTVFPSAAKPEEIAAHLKRALEFVRRHPDVCPADAVIIYAWNEYDEGGWLAPTRGSDGKPDTSRLDAIRKILKPAGGHAPEKTN